MPGRDNREMNGSIMLPVKAKPNEKLGKGRVPTRTWTAADDFDELEGHLTAAEVKRLKEPDAGSGVPILVGDWTGRLGEREPMVGSRAHKAALAGQPLPEAAGDDGTAAEALAKAHTADELKALCDKHGCEHGTKVEMADALVAKGVKPPKE